MVDGGLGSPDQLLESRRPCSIGMPLLCPAFVRVCFGHAWNGSVCLEWTRGGCRFQPFLALGPGRSKNLLGLFGLKKLDMWMHL